MKLCTWSWWHCLEKEARFSWHSRPVQAVFSQGRSTLKGNLFLILHTSIKQACPRTPGCHSVPASASPCSSSLTLPNLTASPAEYGSPGRRELECIMLIRQDPDSPFSHSSPTWVQRVGLGLAEPQKPRKQALSCLLPPSLPTEFSWKG